MFQRGKKELDKCVNVSYDSHNETEEEVNKVSEEIKGAMSGFCLRVLSGNSSPQEVAVLPAILAMLRDSEKAASGN